MDLGMLDVIIVALCNVVGLYLKRQPWYSNKFIPIGNTVVAFIALAAANLGLTPAHADTGAGVLLGLQWGNLGIFILRAILDGFVGSVGVHSGAKNTVEGLRSLGESPRRPAR